MKSIEWTKKRKLLGVTWVMRIFAMKRNNRLFIGAMRNFSKSTNSSGNRFSWRGKALSKSLKKHLRAEKVMEIAGKLYCSNPNWFPMMMMVCCV